MNKPQKKSFKEYYANPEYRKKHIAHMMEYVTCKICDISTSRCNMSKHRKTNKHWANVLKRTPNDELVEMMQSIGNHSLYLDSINANDKDYLEMINKYLNLKEKIAYQREKVLF